MYKYIIETIENSITLLPEEDNLIFYFVMIK